MGLFLLLINPQKKLFLQEAKMLLPSPLKLHFPFSATCVDWFYYI